MIEKVIKVISIIILILTIITLPIFGIMILFGLSSQAKNHFLITAIGYTGIIIFSIVSIFKYKFFPLVLISLIVIILNLALYNGYTSNNNQLHCQQFRENKLCIEDECDFTCLNNHEIVMIQSGSICQDKDMNQCHQKKIRINFPDSKENKAINSYSQIVDKIISSQDPSDENFENQLIAVHNCLEHELNSSIKGELITTHLVQQKKLSQEEIQKYHEYLTLHGRNSNQNLIAAMLPNGDKNNSCNNI